MLLKMILAILLLKYFCHYISIDELEFNVLIFFHIFRIRLAHSEYHLRLKFVYFLHKIVWYSKLSDSRMISGLYVGINILHIFQTIFDFSENFQIVQMGASWINLFRGTQHKATGNLNKVHMSYILI